MNQSTRPSSPVTPHLLLAILPLSLWACGSAPEPRAPRAFVEGPETPAPPAKPAAGVEDQSAYISVSRGIREACGIGETETFFGYDSSSVEPSADALLAKIAECFSRGPLANHSLRLVGHADPRGEDEYNVALGGQRADNVKAYLQTKGLAPTRVTTTSRGESQARGSDEAGWARDRRVDLELGS